MTGRGKRRTAAERGPGLAWWPAGTALLLLGLHLARLAWSGPVVPVDLGSYLLWADRLGACGFDPACFARGIKFDVPPYLYFLWIALLAAARWAGGEGWPWLLALVNVLAVAGAAWFCVRLVRDLTGAPLATLAVGLLPLVSFDLLLWSSYLLSDPLFIFLTCAVLALAIRALGPAPPRTGGLALAGGLAFLALFFRPTALPMLVWLGLALGQRLGLGRLAPARRDRALAALGLASLAATGLVLLATGLMALDWGEWFGGAFRSWHRYLAGIYAEGVVVRHRPETYHQPPSALLDFAWLGLDKFLHYFRFWLPAFSPVHNALGCAFFLPVYVLALKAVADLLTGKGGEARRLAVLLALQWVLGYALFHALQYVDFDWRYRLPTIFPLLLLAGLGLAPGGRERRKGERRPAARAGARNGGRKGRAG